MSYSISVNVAVFFLTLLYALQCTQCFPTDYADAPDASEDENSDKCIGLRNMRGRCEYFRKCFHKEYGSNFSLAVGHSCRIEDTYLGVCCPDRIENVIFKQSLFEEENLANALPAIALDNTSGGSVRVHFHHSEEADHSNKDTNKRDPKRSRGCGTSSKSRTRLVGGRPADPKEWPWMAALLRQGTGQYCGGVLITDRHILTAAHCVYRLRPREIKVRLGEYDFTRPEETRALDFAVSEIRVHRDFDYGSYENDIAILKIQRPTIFNSYIWPVCLPPVEQSFENKTAIVTGWGTQYYGGPASTVLMEVGVPIWQQEKCVRSFTQRIPGTAMCAGAYEGGRDACQGDSGGPLLHQLENGRWVNVGVVSWGIRCGEPGHPGIYTRVNSYLDWIFANAIF